MSFAGLDGGRLDGTMEGLENFRDELRYEVGWKSELCRVRKGEEDT